MHVHDILCFVVSETSEVLVGLDFEGRRAMLVGSKKLHTFTGTDYPSPCRLMLYRYTDVHIFKYICVCFWISVYIQIYLYIFKYTNPKGKKTLEGTSQSHSMICRFECGQDYRVYNLDRGLVHICT